MRKLLLCLVLLFILTASYAQIQESQEKDSLNVPSPKWQDQILYFIMIDRWMDGDPTNNDQGCGEYEAGNRKKYNGGDIQGIIQNLPYLKNLGITALWITPPVANQWWSPWENYGGYHGYWFLNLKEIDKHLGTLSLYQELARKLHQNEMYLIQDIVCNHTGNFFSCKDEKNPLADFRFNVESKPLYKPTQKPFDQNDLTKKEDREAGIYHWTPDIQDYKDPRQLVLYQLMGLDDLNTESPTVRQALKESYHFWIRNGVDGFRVDTALHIDHDFWHDFHHSQDKDALGILPFAKREGKENFLSFAEAWINSVPKEKESDVVVASYLGTPEKPEMVSALHYPMHVEIKRVFQQGESTAYLTYRLSTWKELYRNPDLMVHFVDNHDNPRFLEGASLAKLQQALLFIFTIPGIPCIYYGTEQAFTKTRAAMFASGFGSEGKDHFDETHPMYVFLQRLIEIRKKNAAFRTSMPHVLKDSSSAGIFAYEVTDGEECFLVLFNTSASALETFSLSTSVSAGTRLTTLLSVGATDEDRTVESEGRLSLSLPASSALLLRKTPAARK